MEQRDGDAVSTHLLSSLAKTNSGFMFVSTMPDVCTPTKHDSLHALESIWAGQEPILIARPPLDTRKPLTQGIPPLISS